MVLPVRFINLVLMRKARKTDGVVCFAIYRFICRLNLWKRIDKQGVRNERLNDRFFTIASNGKISIIDHSRLALGVCSVQTSGISVDLAREKVRRRKYLKHVLLC